MKAIFFGSIGTIVETSELQRLAFNRAFEWHDLKWDWSQDTYREMLGQSGGKARIERFALRTGQFVNAKAVHETKTLLFHQLLDQTDLHARDGVLDVLNQAHRKGVKTAFASTTDMQTINRIRAATRGLHAHHFNAVTSDAIQVDPKPSPQIYEYLLNGMALSPADVIVVEDNTDGVSAAKQAGCYVIAMPGANTVGHDYSAADLVIEDNFFDQVSALLDQAASKVA